jgi:lysozyme
MIITQLKRDEGFRGQPYQCTEGFTTIGYGRNLDTNPITDNEAEFMLLNDAQKTLDRLIEVELLPRVKLENLTPRQAVLVNMAFQMGVTGLLKFKKSLAYYLQDDYESCSREMLKSKWARQTPNRAERLVKQMLTGQWVY